MNKENYRKAYSRDNYQCTICGQRATQIAHRIGQTKLNKKLYGNYIIDHVCNIKAVCSLECNKKVDVSEITNLNGVIEVLLDIINHDRS